MAGGSRGIGAAASRGAEPRTAADVSHRVPRPVRREARRQARGSWRRGSRSAGARSAGDVRSGGRGGSSDEAAAALGGLDAFVDVRGVAHRLFRSNELTAEDYRELTMRGQRRAVRTSGAGRPPRHMGRARGAWSGCRPTGAASHPATRATRPTGARATGRNREHGVRFPRGVARGPDGSRSTPSCPGPTDTEAFDAMGSTIPRRSGSGLAAATPMGRMGTPEDAARLIALALLTGCRLGDEDSDRLGRRATRSSDGAHPSRTRGSAPRRWGRRRPGRALPRRGVDHALVYGANRSGSAVPG